MAELNVNKSAFDACYDALKALSASLHDATNLSLDTSGDTSQTGEKELQCYKALQAMISDLAALADETAQDVRLTQACYLRADK